MRFGVCTFGKPRSIEDDEVMVLRARHSMTDPCRGQALAWPFHGGDTRVVSKSTDSPRGKRSISGPGWVQALHAGPFSSTRPPSPCRGLGDPTNAMDLLDEKGRRELEPSLCCERIREGVEGYIRHLAPPPVCRRPRTWPQANPGPVQATASAEFLSFRKHHTSTCPLTSVHRSSWTDDSTLFASKSSLIAAGPAITSTSPNLLVLEIRSRSGSTSLPKKRSGAARSPLSASSSTRSDTSPTPVTPKPVPSCGPPPLIPSPEDPETMYSYLWDTTLARFLLCFCSPFAGG